MAMVPEISLLIEKILLLNIDTGVSCQAMLLSMTLRDL